MQELFYYCLKSTKEAVMKKTVGRPATGLENEKNVNFRWNDQGIELINKRAKENGMNFAAYMRFAVEREAGIRE